jgi:hypothetical protein
VEQGGDRRRSLPWRLAVLAVWGVLAGYLAWHHVFWRDEVRALSLATSGDSWAAMLRGIRSEGHPSLWYLLLRAAHDIVPVRQVLPVVAGLIGAAAATLIALRAPFSTWRIALILFGAFAVYEYTVSARNYGIGMLLLLLATHLYPKHRDRSVLLGLLLALLCNTNVHSAFMAAAMLLFWAIELLGQDGWCWTSRWRWWLINAGIAAVGAALCAATIYPPVNDAAVTVHPGGIGAGMVVQALLTPADAFWALVPAPVRSPVGTGLLAILLLGAPIGLIRAPAAMISSLLLLLVFLLFFNLVYSGSYRHQALYLLYLVAMYWLVALGRGGRWPSAWGLNEPLLTRWSRIGTMMFVALLALQLLGSVTHLVDAARGCPESSARDLGVLLRQRGLSNAILVADPDILLEPVPYYATNRLYLLRSGRFGAVVPFTRHARLHMSLNDFLLEMQQLRARYHAPIVAVLRHPLDPAAPPAIEEEVYVWTFSTTPEQVRTFQAATTRLAVLRRAVGDEVYDVYLLR